jgi:hypothetical protein
LELEVKLGTEKDESRVAGLASVVSAESFGVECLILQW